MKGLNIKTFTTRGNKLKLNRKCSQETNIFQEFADTN